MFFRPLFADDYRAAAVVHAYVGRRQICATVAARAYGGRREGNGMRRERGLSVRKRAALKR